MHSCPTFVILQARTARKSRSTYDPFSPHGKGALSKSIRELRVIYDSAVICAFNAIPPDMVAALLAAITGRDCDQGQLFALAERVSNLERLYNVREGIRREHDTLPARLLTEPLPDGPARGQTVELDVMLDDFYAACGWDRASGIPTRAKLAELGLLAYAGGLPIPG